jgi:RNA polymerase sigma factor (sigma-70 family)
LDSFIAGLGRRYGLSVSEREEARQEANLSLLEATRRFRIVSDGKPCGFLSFLKRVVRSRFQDTCRSRRRAERHLDRWQSVAMVLEEKSADGKGRVPLTDGANDGDPIEAAEYHEAQTVIGRALLQLPPLQRRMAECWMRGQPLAATAADLGVTYAVARRLATQLTDRLRTKLTALAD